MSKWPRRRTAIVAPSMIIQTSRKRAASSVHNQVGMRSV